jgi:cyclopropane-fatty-acyl-phospholipid synthase
MDEFLKIVRNNTKINIIFEKEITKDKYILIKEKDKMFEKIEKNGKLGLIEAYIYGYWSTDNLSFCIEEFKKKYIFAALEIGIAKKYKNMIVQKNNSLEQSKKNINFHYDIGNDLFVKMLGKTMQYTCAYYHKKNMTLDEAQYTKMKLIAKKLDLKPGMVIAELGCGYGSLAYFLVTNYKVKVIGVTLSKNQVAYANKHYKHENLNILYKDYRELKGKYDRVFSIGIFEHVGKSNYKTYYDKCYNLLKIDGIMLIHTIVSSNKSTNFNGFLEKYIFPQGELPCNIDFFDDYSDKWILEDIQNIGMSYYYTLLHWKKNIGNWNNLNNYDNKFKRIWEYYLVYMSLNFKFKDFLLYQLVYTKKKSNRDENCNYITL